MLLEGEMYIGIYGFDGSSKPKPVLRDYCGLENLLLNGADGGNISIGNNAYNPTVQDIQHSNCSQ